MTSIIIGTSGGRNIGMDLDVLLRTRLLCQANSGGGKSYLLRRLAEQLFGKVPVWIIDPEGEFASLREKFGFFLVGKGGETPADPRTAELVCHKLLEVGASAIFDIYDLKPSTRHHWVRVFLEALMNTPKPLWKHVVLMLDESHCFAPEKGQGESEAFAAVQDVASRGRKRGICLAAFLQRLARLSKTVSAELLNRLVGMTFEDVDVDRAEAVLSISRTERERFRKEIKELKPGQFYGLGAAIAKDRTLIQVGGIQTTHPEVGKKSYAAGPPPTPDKIKALLPKFQDLPKEAEDKARTESELRAEIRSLKGKLNARPTAVSEPRLIEVPIWKAGQLKVLSHGVDVAFKAAQRLDAACQDLGRAATSMRESAADLRHSIEKASRTRTEAKAIAIPHPAPMKVAPTSVEPAKAYDRNGLSEGLSPAQLRILNAISAFEHWGIPAPAREMVAPLAGATHRSSAYTNNLGALRSAGYLDYGPGTLSLTAAGHREADPKRFIPEDGILDRCVDKISPAQARILRAAAATFPRALSRAELAALAGASERSSAYTNNLGALRTARMIEYVGRDVRCEGWVLGQFGSP